MAGLCEMWEVSRRGLSAYAQQPAAPRIDRDDVARLERVNAMHAETGQRDGRRRMATPLPAEGLTVGRATARRLMRDAGLSVRRRTRRGPVTTDRQQRDPVAPNRLARPLEVETPDHVWVGDLTSVWTAEGGYPLPCGSMCRRGRSWVGP